MTEKELEAALTAERRQAMDGWNTAAELADKLKAAERVRDAAPELLAALERVLECHRHKISLDTNSGAVEQARAAIAKAKGE